MNSAKQLKTLVVVGHDAPFACKQRASEHAEGREQNPAAGQEQHVPGASSPPETLSTGRQRIFIIDDHPLVRDGLTCLINNNPDLAVCGVADGGGAALEAVEALKPDIVLLDVALQANNGLELLKKINATWPEQRVLVLSMHEESMFAARCLRLGASGYIMKSEAPETLMLALRKVLNGGFHLSERMSKRLLPNSVRSRAGRRGIDPFDELTSRESQVLQLVGQGKAPREISLEMSVSVRTVDTYLTHLRDKLHLNNRLQVVRYALGCVRDKAA